MSHAMIVMLWWLKFKLKPATIKMIMVARWQRWSHCMKLDTSSSGTEGQYIRSEVARPSPSMLVTLQA